MTKDEIMLQTKQVLQELFELDEAVMTPTAKLYDDLDIDSIDAVDLMVELKQVAGIQLKPEAFKEVTTLQDVVDTIYSVSRK